MTVDTRDNVILVDFQERAAEELAAGNIWITAATEEEIVAANIEPANLPGVQFVSLSGRVGAWSANQGNRNKTTPPVLHYNGPATGIPSGADPVARLIGSARYHQQIDWGGGARANGLQYHSAVWDDVIFLCRNPLSILWHSGHAYNFTSHACHVPIGGNERATAQTLRTLKLWFDEINRTWGTKGAYGHKELSSTACPGTLQPDFVAKYRAGHDFGTKPKPPTPAPEPEKPEKPPNGGDPVDSLWLPNAPRSSFRETDAYTKEDLEGGKVHVLTLDGEDRAAIVPRGMAFDVPKPEEKPPEKEPEPEPEPEPEKPPVKLPDMGSYRKDSHLVADKYLASLRPSWHAAATYQDGTGLMVAEEADRAGLDLALCYAVAEGESAGRHVFGADRGGMFPHMAVTKERVDTLIRHVRAGGISNGVSIFQATYKTFLYEADTLPGGASVPRNTARVCLNLLFGHLKNYGYWEGIERYNGFKGAGVYPYARGIARLHEAWKRRIA